MNPQANMLALAAMNSVAGAIQDLALIFIDGRTPAAQRRDLELARERLSFAMSSVTEALAVL